MSVLKHLHADLLLNRPQTMLDVVFATDRRGVIPAAVAARSVLDSTDQPDRLRIHIVHSGLDATQLSCMQRTLEIEPAPAAAEFHEFDVQRVSGLLRSKNIPSMAYARLFISDFLPEQATRAVYLDFDTVTRRDLCELQWLPLKGHLVAAVPNGDPVECRRQAERLGLTTPRYFNSGVMLVDVPAWRAERVGEAALKFAGEFPGALIMHDQDALNAAVADRWLELPSEWNTWAIHTNNAERKVIHFTMSPKPWHLDYDGPHPELFFAGLERTAFRGWRPANPLGMGRLYARIRRRIPYLPTVYRRGREWLRSLIGRNGGVT